MSRTLLTARELAETLGLDESSVRGWIRRGLPTVTQGGRQLIDPAGAAKWRAHYLSSADGGWRPAGSTVDGAGRASVAGAATVSIAAAAKVLGVPRAEMLRLIRAGLIVATDAGEIDVELARRALAGTGRPETARARVRGPRQAPSRVKRQPAPAPEPLPSAADPATDPAGYIANTSTDEARRQRECAKALLAMRRVERVSAEWVRVEDVAAALDNKFAAVRQRLVSIASSVAGPCAGQSAGRIKSALMRAINEALQDLSGPPGGGPNRKRK